MKVQRLALGEHSAGQLGIEGTGRFALGELGAGQLGIEGTGMLSLGELRAGQLGIEGTGECWQLLIGSHFPSRCTKAVLIGSQMVSRSVVPATDRRSILEQTGSYMGSRSVVGCALLVASDRIAVPATDRIALGQQQHPGSY